MTKVAEFFKRARGLFRREDGLTLVELLVVMSILGVLAAIVVGNVTGMTTEGRDQSVVADTDAIQKAVDSYYGDSNKYPLRADPFLKGAEQVAGTWGGTDYYINFYYVTEVKRLLSAVPKSAGPDNVVKLDNTKGTGSYDWWVDYLGKVHYQNTENVTDTFNGKYP